MLSDYQAIRKIGRMSNANEISKLTGDTNYATIRKRLRRDGNLCSVRFKIGKLTPIFYGIKDEEFKTPSIETIAKVYKVETSYVSRY